MNARAERVDHDRGRVVRVVLELDAEELERLAIDGRTWNADAVAELGRVAGAALRAENRWDVPLADWCRDAIAVRNAARLEALERSGGFVEEAARKWRALELERANELERREHAAAAAIRDGLEQAARRAGWRLER